MGDIVAVSVAVGVLVRAGGCVAEAVGVMVEVAKGGGGAPVRRDTPPLALNQRVPSGAMAIPVTSSLARPPPVVADV